MFWKRSGDLISISADGQGESLSFGAGELADIRYACAWPGSCAVLLTAARTSTDRASVRQNRSITPQSVRAELLDAVGIRTARVSQAVVSFNDLSLFEGRVIVSAGVHHPETFERFWYGIVQLPYQEHPLGIVAPIERPWRVGNLSSTGDTLCLTLERFENARLAGTLLMAIGRRQEFIAAGW